MHKMTSFILAASMALVSLAHAQTFPDRLVKLVVPTPPGGGTDVIARIIAPKLSEIWGQPVIIENRGGGGGNIGAITVASSPSDGYTLFVSHGGVLTINPVVFSKLNFDPVRDFVPVTQMAATTYVLTVNPNYEAQSVAELVRLAKSKPGELNWASSQVATADHLAGEQFQLSTGVRMTHVPYKGSQEAMVDLLSGRIQVAIFSLPIALPYITGGRLRALGVMDDQRSKLAPDIPTLAEGGVPNATMLTWYGVWAPANTPAAIVDRLQRDISMVLQSEYVRSRLEGIGFRIVGSTSDAFGRFMAAEAKKYSDIANAIGLEKR
jgi:tripartite-type tricarboxylate transporter receptor subunit TctC